MTIFTSPNPSLRFGLDLCLDEKQFLSERKCRISDGIKALLGTDRCPKNANEGVRVSSLNFHDSKIYDIMKCYNIKLLLIVSFYIFPLLPVPANLLDDIWGWLSSNDCLLWCLQGYA